MKKITEDAIMEGFIYKTKIYTNLYVFSSNGSLCCDHAEVLKFLLKFQDFIYNKQDNNINMAVEDKQTRP